MQRLKLKLNSLNRISVSKLMFLIIVGFCPPAFSEDFMLVIAAIENQAITQDHSRMQADKLQAHYPEKKVVVIAPKHKFRIWDLVSTNENSERTAINTKLITQEIQEFAMKLRPSDRITHLILNTHGSSENYPTDSKTVLKSLGEFNEYRVSPSFKKMFNPLLPYLPDTLAVILNACRTHCGSSKKVKARTESLMKYFGAKNGVLWGTTSIVLGGGTDYKNMSKRNLIKHDLKTFAPIINTGSFILSLSAGLMTAMTTWAQTTEVDYQATREMVAQVYLGLMTAAYSVKGLILSSTYSIAKNGALDQGIIHVLKDGKVIKEEKAEYYLSKILKRIDPKSCNNIFIE